MFESDHGFFLGLRNEGLFLLMIIISNSDKLFLYVTDKNICHRLTPF